MSISVQICAKQFGLYIIMYYTFGQRFKYSPGELLGLSIRGALKATWWLARVLVLTVVRAVEELLGLHLDARSVARPGRHVVEGAHFLKGWNRWRLMGRRHDGLVIDGVRRISLKRSYRHLALVAPTGTGKTSAYVTPNLLKLKPQFSAVVTDPSSELVEQTSGYLRQKGFGVKVLDVSHPEHSFQFNPLHRARTPTQVEELCDILVRAAYGSRQGDQQFWNTGAKSILSILIRCLDEEQEEYRNLHNVLHLINLFGSDGKPLYDFIAERADEQTFTVFKGFISNSDKVIQGMVATARTALKPFADPELCRLTAGESLQFETLRQKPTVLYLCVPEHRMAYYGFLLSLFWTQFFSYCMEGAQAGSPYVPVFCFLDEFGNVSRIPNFEQLITTLRKRQVSVSIILQDVQQLVSVYGQANASTILNGGCSSRLYLPGLGHETCRDLERILGRQTVRDGAKEKTRNLLSADEIRTLDDHQAIFLHANKRPVLLRMTPYYKSLRLRSRLKYAPAPRPAVEDATPVKYLDPTSEPDTATSGASDLAEESPDTCTDARPDESGPVSQPSSTADGTRQEQANVPTTSELVCEAEEVEEETQQESVSIDPGNLDNEVSAATPPSEPPWATELIEESRRAREEVEGLRETIAAHVVSRKEAARILGKSTRTLQRWEKRGLLERVNVSAPGVHYDYEQVLELKRRKS